LTIVKSLRFGQPLPYRRAPSSHHQERGIPRMANVRSGGLSVLLVVCMLAAMVGDASAAGPDRRLAATSVTDATRGAVGRVELWQRGSDGAVYPKVWVADARADGVCAHATVQWLHRNGNVYTDYGSWICGAGTSSKEPSVKGARNWRDYRSVSIAAFVDNGTPAAAPLYDFIAHPPTFEEDDGAPTEPVGDPDGGGIGAIGSASTYRAGRHLTIKPWEGSARSKACTAAFAITTAEGVSGLTAGHCATGNRTHTGDAVFLEIGDQNVWLGTVAATLAKGYDDRGAVNGTDAQMFPIGDHPYEQVIARGNKTPWKVRGTLRTILQDPGTKVCFAGRSSGADQCGEIRTGGVKHLKCTDIEARRGDSGGPVYTRARNGKTLAVGIVSLTARTRFWQDGGMCYEPIEQVLDGLDAKLAGT
jgi:hypothetical protein